MSAGKGDNPRPFSVTPEVFAANFDAIDWNARAREQAAYRLRAEGADFAAHAVEVGFLDPEDAP